jgi:hypothetical protein
MARTSSTCSATQLRSICSAWAVQLRPDGCSLGVSEIDVEVQVTLNNPNDPNDVEYSIQPTNPDPTHRQKALPLGGPPYVAKFVWARDHVTFSVTDASGNTHSFVRTNLPAPPAKTTQTDVNLWLFNNKAPVRGQPVEIILNSFSYTPALRRQFVCHL